MDAHATSTLEVPATGAPPWAESGLELSVPKPIEDAEDRRFDAGARDRQYRWALVLGDLSATALAMCVTFGALGHDLLRPASLLMLPLVVALAKISGLYARDELLIHKTTVDEAPYLFNMATLGTLVFSLAHGSILTGYLSAGQGIVLWATLFGFLLLTRSVARDLARRGVSAERILFVGDPTSYERLRTKIETAAVAAELIGRMSFRADAPAGSGGRATELDELITWTGAHRVIIEPRVLPPEEILDFVRSAKAAGVRVSLLPRILDVVGSSVVFDQLDGMTVLGVRRFGLSRSSVIVKRTFDVLGAIGILVFSAPVLAVIALLIKLDSPGPAFFRQSRVGRDGRPFEICKFRTMVTDAELRKGALREANEATGGLFKIADDPRVTRVGRLLRRTALDELPQLFNVLRGDMSLVGPRPLVHDEDALITGWDRGRLHLTPGMTGPWQVAGSSRIPLAEMVKIDYLYVAGWSLWSDLKILVRTVPYMVARRGM
jgi:exopolysaccharide biosynthesis polyprenyl glycosylphosphotransferase